MKTFSVYDDIPLAVCALRKSRKTMDVIYANAAMTWITGAPDIRGQEFHKIWQRPEAVTLVNKLKGLRPPRSYVLPTPSEEGEEKRWVNFLITEDRWEDTDIYLLWGTDISATKAYEAELVSAAQRADAVAEMKSNFLATMSHEIRTPMQTIYGLLELIADEKPDVKTASMVATAQQAASGLLEILDDVLDLAKMDANKMDLDVFEVPVRTLVRGILEALAVKVHGKKLQLKDRIESDVPFVIIGDPKRLRQIIMNLAGNALKFTSEGSVTVSVSRKTQRIKIPEKHIGLRFEITDTGIGMSEEICAKLFQSFTQADNTTTRKYGGTGLGLSICKRLTELMGGDIGVTSQPGQGSTFWFEISTEEVSADTTTVKLPTLTGISVLSVEDHPQGAKEIVNSLRSMGANVESCPTYAEARELIKRRPFDVAVVDQGLPDGLGLDLIKEIMTLRPFTGLIMYTVRDDVGLQHSLHALGVTYLTKPAGRAGLGEAVLDASKKSAHISIEGPTRLLIAEDTLSVRDVLRRQLEKIGVEADFVENGREAVAALETGKYGILITDLHMPEVDGYQLANFIRNREKLERSEKQFPVIVLTADVQMSQREIYLSHGFDECLLKPVSLGQFRRLLIRWGLLSQGDALASNKEAADAKTGPSAVDITAIADMMGAFDQDALDMLKMFAGMTSPLVERLQSAQKNGDFRNLAEAAHSLKGAARSACCPALGDLAAKLQDDSEKNVPAENLVHEIAAEFERVKREISELKIS